MTYSYNCSELPKVNGANSVIRKTIWQIADPFHILVFIKNGGCVFEMNGRIYELAKGDILYIPAKTVHIRKPLDDSLCEMVYIHFTLPAEEGVQGDPCDPKRIEDNSTEASCGSKQMMRVSAAAPAKKLHFLLADHMKLLSDYDLIAAKTNCIIKHFSGTGFFDRQTADFELCSLLSLLSVRCSQSILSNPLNRIRDFYPDSLKEALKYIKSHYTQPISLDDLCAVSHVSGQMLIKHFNKAFGMSPLKYIAEYKINCIKPFLTRYPDMSVKEICEEFGFEDQCYFSRLFKKHTGESPTEYRLRVCNFNQEKHISESRK